MSLWLQSAADTLRDGQYGMFREKLLPAAPAVLPGCILREVEFGERLRESSGQASLFPIRLMWLWEAKEQELFGIKPLGRSKYHPEKLLEVWHRVDCDTGYRLELETSGFRFDFTEKAIMTASGWVLIGERFAEDFRDIERAAEVELLFADKPGQPGRRLFASEKFF